MAVHYDFRWRKQEHIRQSARSFGRERSLFSSMMPWTPPTDNMEGLVSYYDPKRISRVRSRLKGTDKRRYLQEILIAS